MKNTLKFLGVILILTNSCYNDCPETIDSVLFYPVMKYSIDNKKTVWAETNYLYSNISFVMELKKSGGGSEFCHPYTTNEINESSIKILCNKPLNLDGISIPANENIKDYFEIEKDCYVSGYIEGYLFTLKSDYRSIFQNDTYTIIGKAKSNKNQLFTDSCLVTINSKDSIVFNPDLTYGSVTDIDNNTYKTIVIGNQTWMAENLKTTKYNNGDLIGTTIPSTLDISNSNNPKYQWASGSDESNVETFGRLYTWYTVIDSRKLCPKGWHIPTNAEWDTLSTYLGIFPIAHKIKEDNNLHWNNDLNNPKTNESGFSALPSGRRESIGRFEFGSGYWWSASESTDEHSFSFDIWYDMSIPEPYVFRTPMSWGLSVRCIKD